MRWRSTDQRTSAVAPTSAPGRIEVGRASVHDMTAGEAADAILELAGRRAGAVVVTPNIHHIANLERVPELRASYDEADLVLADGWPVVVAMRLAGGRIRGRVAGADLLPAVSARAGARGLTVALVGGGPGSAPAAAARLTATTPGLRCGLATGPVLSEDPTPEQLDGLVDTINTVRPDVLFLGVGSPKQEIVIHRIRGRVDVGVTVCVGAAIDFASGVQARAPRLLQGLGLEWAHRIATNPRRMASRYLVAAPRFLRAAGSSVRRQRSAGRRE